MFIKIFVPNENGKIELTVEELENIIQEAAEQALKEKCDNCNKNWYEKITTTPTIVPLLDKNHIPPRNGEITWSWDKVTCGSNATNVIGDLDTLRSPINGQLNLDVELEKFNNNKRGDL